MSARLHAWLRYGVAAATTVLALQLAHAAVWGPETRITNAVGHSLAPRVAAFNGVLHAVWFDYVGAGPDPEILYARSVDNGNTWSTPVDISANPSRPDLDPSIAADASGVYVVWNSDINTGDVFFKRSLDNGQSWQAEQQLTNATGESRVGGITLEANGTLHVVYYDNRLGYTNIYHRQSCDHGFSWTAEQNVTVNDGVVDNEVPRLAVGQDGKLYLTFRSSREGDPQGGWPPYQIYLLRGVGAACPGNPAWLYPAQRVTRGLPDEYSDAYAPEIAAGPSGAVHVAFWDQLAGSGVGYRHLNPTGPGFGPTLRLSNLGANHPQAGPNNSEAGNLGIVEDDAGTLHLLFAENAGVMNAISYGRLFYRSSPDAGVTWSAVTQVGTTSTASMPKLVYAGGRVHAVWTDFRDNNVGGEIYYRNLNLQCPGGLARASARRDFNGDGRADITWANTATGEKLMQLMNGGAVVGGGSLLTDPNWQIAQYGDFNGDGATDLIWYNASTGATAMWLMSGGTIIGGGGLLTSPAWSVIKTGDFNGDGKADLLWRNSVTGEVVIWLMNGSSIIGANTLLTDLNWIPTLIADFNGDGKDDILWRNASTGETVIWLMNGANFAGGASIMKDPNWVATNTGDFNGDGRADILWHNNTGGSAVWLMNGTSLLSGAGLIPDPNWNVVGVDDFDGDGKSDILWRNTATGATAIWLMNGTSFLASGGLLPAPWLVSRTGDFNGDGMSDILWTNPTTGEKVMWLMNGVLPAAGYTLSNDPNWSLCP